MFNWIFTDDEKRIILSLIAKGIAEENRNDKFAIIDFDNFYQLFSNEEIEIIKRYMAINPEEIGCKLPYLGLEDNPGEIIPIANQVFTFNGQEQIRPCQYLPKITYEAYQKLNEAIKKELNKNLLVLYGYRSPARQVFAFFDSLVRHYNFDFLKTSKRFFFPTYSEHVFTKRQAIDFMTSEGIKGVGFEKTDEYKWLKENAGRFGFIESYPLNNKFDVMYEPWHWRHQYR